MSIPRDQPVSEAEITVNDDVIAYIKERNCDFRICTSCGGPVLLHTNMEAGHAGSAGRFDSLKETALAYAFAITAAHGGWGRQV